MTIEITKKFNFEAAHFLPNHVGKCRNLHGHSYCLYITVKGDLITSGPKEGMIMDFGDLSSIVNKDIISRWDHCCLNDVVSFVPTSENLAMEVFNVLKSKGLNISRVRLSETSKTYVDVYSD